MTPEMMSLPAGLDPNKFKMNPDGSVSYRNDSNQTKIPLGYFQSPQYQQDLKQYGQIMGPGFIFAQGAPTWNGGAYTPPNTAQGFDPAMYMQDEYGNPVGWSAGEGSRLQGIDQAYNALRNGSSSSTDFSQFGQHPDKLGTDVFSALANGGTWMPPGSDVSGQNRPLQAIRQDDGTILVVDPRGGDGANPNYYYDASGNFLKQGVGSKAMSPAQGVGSVALAGLGFGALGGLTGVAAAGQAGAGVTGLSSGADLSAFYGGLDGGATLGGGASVAGGSALGAGAGGLGVTGFGSGADANAFFGGLDNGATLGGGSSVNGGAALGAGGGALQGVPPPANPGASGMTNPLTGNPISTKDILGAATTVGGALSGSQGGAGGSGSGGGGGVLDSRLEPYLYGADGLLPKTQGLLNSQMPQAQAQAAQMAQVGSGLLGQPIAGNGYGTVGTNVAGNGYGTVGTADPGNGFGMLTSRPVAGNGFGSVQMDDPRSFMNPFYGGMADDISRRTNDTLGQSFNTIRGNAVGVGGLGGSRQGVAEGSAIGKAADSLQGNLAGLGGNMFQSALSGALNKYGTDTNFYTNQRGQDLTKYTTDASIYGQQRGQDLQKAAQDQAFYGQQRNTDLAKAGQDQSFYGQQRGQDQAGAQLGAGLLGASQTQAWAPLTNAAGIYRPFTGLSSSSGDSGTNWSGLLGGALSGAALAGKLGFWS